MKFLRNAALFISAAAALSFAAHAAPAKPAQPVLWNKVRSGMTFAEVQKIMPGAKLESETIIGGPTNVAGAPFDSFVEMDAGRVSVVKLIGNGVDGGNVASALTAKYGPATSPYTCSRSSCSGTWSAPGSVKITLLRWSALLTLSYKAVDLSNI